MVISFTERDRHSEDTRLLGGRARWVAGRSRLFVERVLEVNATPRRNHAGERHGQFQWARVSELRRRPGSPAYRQSGHGLEDAAVPVDLATRQRFFQLGDTRPGDVSFSQNE